MQFGIRSAGLVLAFMLPIAGAARAQAPAGTFASVEGDVELQRGGAEPQRPTVGGPLLVKDALRVGDAGRVRILLNDETILDLASASQIVLQADGSTSAAGDRTTVKLNEGMVRAWVAQPARQSSSFEIETPTALVRTRGGEIIVDLEADDGGSDILCLRGQAQVQGTLGVIGKGVELVADRATRVPRGGLPSAARDIDRDSLATYQRSLEIIGTGSNDHLAAGHPLVSGNLMAPTDRPQLPPSAQAAAARSYLQTGPPGETLIEQLSPDLRTNTQSIPEYELAEPGLQPPPIAD